MALFAQIILICGGLETISSRCRTLMVSSAETFVSFWNNPNESLILQVRL